MTSPSRFDYEGMQAIAQRLAQRSADLQTYLDQMDALARTLAERCHSPFAQALLARHARWHRAGQELAQSLHALATDLARIAAAQQAAEEREGARFAHLPE
jgi:uncharacterized protein YukE